MSNKMNLYLKRASLADVRIKLFEGMEANLEAEFLELMVLREQVRQAEISAGLQKPTRAKRHTQGVIAAAA